MDILEMVRVAGRSLALHKMRSALTCLGIVFGVAAVIAMLSIGEGLRYDALKQIKQLGVQNITVKSVEPPSDERPDRRSQTIAYGLTYADARHIGEVCAGATAVVPLKGVCNVVRFLGRTVQADVIGTVPEYLPLAGLSVDRGRFLTQVDEQRSANVCVLGSAAKKKLFGFREALGEMVRMGQGGAYCVVGVLEPQGEAGKIGAMTVMDVDREVYIPLSTAISSHGDIIEPSAGGGKELRIELSGILVRVSDPDEVEGTAALLSKMLANSHTREDYAVVVPKSLLRQGDGNNGHSYRNRASLSTIV